MNRWFLATSMIFALLVTDARAELPAGTLALPEQVKSFVIGCGVAPAMVRIERDESSQEDSIFIRPQHDPLPLATILCIAKTSLKTSYDVCFDDPIQQKRYSQHYEALAKQQDIASARAWLAGRGMLDRAPRLAEGQPLSSYAVSVEAFCGVKPKTLLVATSNHFLTFAKDGLGHLTAGGITGAAATSDQFECVTNTIDAADLGSRGIEFGFIGNEVADR